MTVRVLVGEADESYARFLDDKAQLGAGGET